MAKKENKDSDFKGNEKIILLARPRAPGPDWWPKSSEKEPSWATVNPIGGYVIGLDGMYAFTARKLKGIKADFLEEHDGRSWVFRTVLAADIA